jgi:hypothetical protein
LITQERFEFEDWKGVEKRQGNEDALKVGFEK